MQVPPIIIDQSVYETFFDISPHKYSIEEVTIYNDTLRVSVSYQGGCEEHEFILIGSSNFAYSYPPIVYTLITHETKDDPCQNPEFEELLFDLSPLQTIFNTETRTILVNLRGVEELIQYQF